MNENIPVSQINRVYLHSFLANQAGKIMAVDFVKKDGQARVMCFRLGVTKHLKGGKNNVMSPDRSYLTVYDLQSRGYRTVDLSTAKQVRANGCVFEVVD